jgi:hypothetical protein
LDRGSIWQGAISQADGWSQSLDLPWWQSDGEGDTPSREVRQELGVQIEAASLIDYYDRPEKSNVTFLFRVLLKPGHQLRIPKDEIEKYAFRNSVPQLATPSLEYFWSRAQKSFEPLSLL